MAAGSGPRGRCRRLRALRYPLAEEALSPAHAGDEDPVDAGTTDASLRVGPVPADSAMQPGRELEHQGVRKRVHHGHARMANASVELVRDHEHAGVVNAL